MLAIKSGNVGSGKTLSTIQIICERLLLGRNVISNIDFNYDKFVADNTIRRGLFHKTVEASSIGKFYHVENITVVRLMIHAYLRHDLESGNENQTLVIIDEAREYFDARTWNTDKTRGDWRVFLEQHRKLKYNLIFICQDFEDIDPKIMKKAEYIEHHRKVNNSFGGGFLLNMLRINLFLNVIRWNTKANKVYKKEFFRFKKKYGSYYKTNQLLNGLEEKFNMIAEKLEAGQSEEDIIAELETAEAIKEVKHKYL